MFSVSNLSTVKKNYFLYSVDNHRVRLSENSHI